MPDTISTPSTTLTADDVKYVRLVLDRCEALAAAEEHRLAAIGARQQWRSQTRSRRSLAASLRNYEKASEKAFSCLLDAIYGSGTYSPIERVFASLDTRRAVGRIFTVNGPTLGDAVRGTGTQAVRRMLVSAGEHVEPRCIFHPWKATVDGRMCAQCSEATDDARSGGW
jgi:hypothetical protein